jgi:hypothetical protein
VELVVVLQLEWALGWVQVWVVELVMELQSEWALVLAEELVVVWVQV